MKKQTTFFLIILIIYIFFQFAWWGHLLIQLNEQVARSDADFQRRVWMILGEGIVFMLILFLGIFKMRQVILKEIALTQRQSNFLLSITHELKTPISSIKLFLQTFMKHELTEEKKQDLINKALDENERLSLLIENILHASRVENKTLHVVKSAMSFVDSVQPIVDRFHKRLQKNYIQINAPEILQFNCDPFLFELIIVNLLENATKYAGETSHITVFGRVNKQMIEFGVQDEGPGIPPNEREAIFDKFYRIGNEETRQQAGSGLGLFIVAEFTTLLGGKINYKQNSPVGSIFEVTLPL